MMIVYWNQHPQWDQCRANILHSESFCLQGLDQKLLYKCRVIAQQREQSCVTS